VRVTVFRLCMFEVRIAQKSAIARLQAGIAIFERHNQAFGPGKIANREFILCQAKDSNAGNDFRPPDWIIFHEIEMQFVSR